MLLATLNMSATVAFVICFVSITVGATITQIVRARTGYAPPERRRKGGE